MYTDNLVKFVSYLTSFNCCLRSNNILWLMHFTNHSDTPLQDFILT